MKLTGDCVIGLEIHIELDTNTKIFCPCSRKSKEDEGPNTRVCEVCIGAPGSKPVLNKKAVEYALKLGLALNCDISPDLIFSRKSYFYPDMAKNYQISQYEIPLGEGGFLEISSGKKIGIIRVHLEEDPAAMIHPKGMEKSSFVLVDYNRSGNPLVEVVTRPDMASPDEARDFMKKLIKILGYLEIFDIENGIIKADANISIKDSGYVRSEVKNITGFKEIERALKYEVERQKKEISDGKKLVQDTRAWDSDIGITRLMRTKETEADYGYIIDPDLVVTEITNDWIDDIKADMPELGQDKVKKYINDYKIDKIDAEVIAAERLLAELFEKVANEIDPILAAKWLRRELLRVLNYNKKSMKELLLDERHMIDLLKLVESGKITETSAQKIIEKLVEKPFDVNKYVEKEKLGVVSDKKEIEELCKKAISENPEAVRELKAGNEKSFNFLIGKVMQATKGQADPKEVNSVMKKLLK
ncbi:MAG: Asp-tRNA(Asn)/Glu-tRNA(Gln) amidotransferase subunit GatB [Candidatus Woesearchaeota archaeon]